MMFAKTMHGFLSDQIEEKTAIERFSSETLL